MLWGCGALDFISLPSNPVIRKFYFWPVAGFYPCTFVYSRFSTKIQFPYCSLSSISIFRFPVSWWYMYFWHYFWLQQHILYIVCLERQRFILEVRVFPGVLKKSWLGESSWRDWVSLLNSRLNFYCRLPVIEKCLENCLLLLLLYVYT